jgi:beta-glucosidase
MTFPESEKDQPPKHLRGFQKINLDAGESTGVEMRLRKKDLSVWNVEKQTWYIPSGTFTFRVGHSSRNLVLEAEREIVQEYQ